MFQQDGAPAHTSNMAQGWIKRNLAYSLDKHHWPPNSPDLNPLDFHYWNAVVTRMNVKNITDLDAFIAEISRAASTIPSEEISRAVLAFTKRVRDVEDVKGHYPYRK